MSIFSRTKKVLVVEDDPSLHKALVSKLQREGYKTVSVTDGNEVMATLQSEHVDAVILDLMLPNKDGMSLLKMMREDVDFEKPVFILTNLYGNAGLREEADGLCAYYFDKATTNIDAIIEAVKKQI